MSDREIAGVAKVQSDRGNSVKVTIPIDVADGLDIQKGDRLFFRGDTEGGFAKISPRFDALADDD